MDKYLDFYSKAEREEIVAAIQRAEAKTSGEIRVHLEDHCDHRPRDRAAFVFKELGMQATQERNGVLFYIAVCDHDFAVIGDAGIHEKVGESYWDRLCDELEAKFKAGAFKGGLVEAIDHVGTQLATYFPVRADDVNELDDEISMGKL